jgi:hypothetical protein
MSCWFDDIYQCLMYSGKTPGDGQRNCPKRVEFDKNKFGKLVYLLVLLKKKFVTMHGHMNVKNVF